jgi:hypothetical protein
VLAGWAHARIQAGFNQLEHDRGAALKARTMARSVAVRFSDGHVSARGEQRPDGVLLPQKDGVHEGSLTADSDRVERRRVLGQGCLDKRASIQIDCVEHGLSPTKSGTQKHQGTASGTDGHLLEGSRE